MEEEAEEKLYLGNDSGSSYRSSERRISDPLLYTVETIECSVMLILFLVVTILILIFPGIPAAVLSAYSKIRDCGIEQIINDLISQIQQII